MPLLDIHNLNAHYGAIQALHGISLHVDQGQIVALLGANGAGKSTALRAISGLIRPSAGHILFDGQPIDSLAAHRIVHLGISQVPEGRGIFAELTVDENLRLGSFSRHPHRHHQQIVADRQRLFELFPVLRERLRQSAGTLSGGEQQMLAIARALLSRPRLLLLDEPSLGLAPQLVQTIFRTITTINHDSGDGRGATTILLVEQNAHMALACASYAYVLEVGRIVTEGPAAELAQSPAIRAAYLGASSPSPLARGLG
jgi:branched-chain amino acid transport system ATP-binding protein